MTIFRVFNTEAEAITAEELISTTMGYPKRGVSAQTGLDVDVWTMKWAEVIQLPDGRHGFISPDDVGEEFIL
jgi:hypothetical protein